MEGQKRTKKGRLLREKKGWEWEDRHGPKWPAPVGVCGVFFFFPPLFSLLRGKPGEKGGGR